MSNPQRPALQDSAAALHMGRIFSQVALYENVAHRRQAQALQVWHVYSL
jgi:hypothetical protein